MNQYLLVEFKLLQQDEGFSGALFNCRHIQLWKRNGRENL
jgi:hypothetical protein